MPSNLMGAGNRPDRNAADVRAGQDEARAADTRRIAAAAAAGRGSRSISASRPR